MCTIIQSTILEHGAPKAGTAYSDVATRSMYQNYQKPRAAYFVIEVNGQVLGGVGVAPLDNYNSSTAEIQKMYFKPEARGHGWGGRLMKRCLEIARNYQFQQVYIETMDNMLAAQTLYKRYGFELIEQPLGNTGHYSCPVQMLLQL